MIFIVEKKSLDIEAANKQRVEGNYIKSQEKKSEDFEIKNI